jgi:hypothetical protein
MSHWETWPTYIDFGVAPQDKAGVHLLDGLLEHNHSRHAISTHAGQ